MGVVLGVDGGNSKTFALVADTEGRLLGFGRAPGSNHESIGLLKAGEIIDQCARMAVQQAGVDTPVLSGFYGLAGADLEGDIEALTAVMSKFPLATETIVRNDTIVAMAGGTTREWGVGIVCGAGFNATGISPDGRELRLPAMGAPTGDWGGGADIGMETLRLAYRSLDGRGEQTILETRVAEAFGLGTLDEVPSRLRDESLNWGVIRDVLPPVLFAAANEGDKVAIELVVRIGKEVGVNARTIIQRLGMEHLDVEIVLGGSIFLAEGPLLVDTITADVQQAVPHARIVHPEFRPVIGAVFQALRAIGVDVDEAVRHNVRQTLPTALK